MTKLGLRGAMFASNIMGKNLDDPSFEPLWAAAEELGAFMFVHPNNVAGADRLKSYYLVNLIGNPLDTTIAAACLVFGGVMDRHPKLKVCLAHAGGFMPYQAGALDARLARAAGAEEERAEAAGQHRRPLPSTTPSCIRDRSLEFLIERAGADRVMLGSDYPYDMAMMDCVAHVRALKISDADKAAILGDARASSAVGKGLTWTRRRRSARRSSPSAG